MDILGKARVVSGVTQLQVKDGEVALGSAQTCDLIVAAVGELLPIQKPIRRVQWVGFSLTDQRSISSGKLLQGNQGDDDQWCL